MPRILAIWVLLAVLAVGNGAIREGFLTPRLGGPAAHVASTILLCALILLAVGASLSFVGVATPRAAWRAGLAWTALTLAFEFLAGHFVFGNPWSAILADYNWTAGRIWILVPLATLIGPRLALWIRRPVQNGA